MNKADVARVRKHLFGKRLFAVELSDCDEGLSLIFEDGSLLDIGYSGCEGRVVFNGETLPE